MNARPKPYFPTVGWLEDYPQRHGFDGARLLAIRPHVEAQLPHVRSVIVARHGYVVFEMYRQGFGRAALLNLASITKSITALVVGIAHDAGLLTLDQRITEHYPGLIDSPDPRARDITVRHLLSMTAGFDWSDANVAQWRSDETKPRFPLRSALNAAPGARFNYDTPASHLLSAVLHQATGQTELEYARAQLFTPLGITHCAWEADSEGYPYGGHGISLSTRDALKIGLLALREGMWDGVRIVSQDWLGMMLTQQSAGYPDSFGAYGFLWWLQDIRGQRAYYAAGSGGQYLHVVPEQDLLVLVTSNHDRLHAENKQIIRDFVLPAIIA